jgi:hypothetical protein
VAASDEMSYNFLMNQHAKDILRRVETWPEEDQVELAEVAREIEARRSGLYVLDDKEEEAIREALAQLDRGEGVSEEAMEVFWKRCGVK